MPVTSRLVLSEERLALDFSSCAALEVASAEGAARNESFAVSITSSGSELYQIREARVKNTSRREKCKNLAIIFRR